MGVKMFRYADYIYKIYEEKSFTEAAKKLFISQPSLSATVKKAEDELGFKIFDRSSTPLTITDEGRVYISAIEDIKKIERNVRNYIENINNLNIGDISVSGAAFISSFILPEIIMEFSKRHPKIDIMFLESDSVNLQEKLLHEEIDILVDYDFDSKVFEAKPLKKEYILLAVPKCHKINNILKQYALTVNDIKNKRHLASDISYVNLEIFKDEDFIQLKPGNNMQKMSEKICNEYGFSPTSIICVDQLMTAYNIANSGMGITFTTDTVVCSAADNANLIFYRIDSEFAKRMLYIAHKRKTYVSPAVSEFIKVAQEIYKR